MCCHETIHDKWTGVKIKAWLGSWSEYGLERGFAKHWLNSIYNK